jgi:hypothetical protein
MFPIILLEVNNMDNNINDSKDLLKELCIKVINLLNELKENGSIDEEEYQKNIRKKKEFLDNIL